MTPYEQGFMAKFAQAVSSGEMPYSSRSWDYTDGLLTGGIGIGMLRAKEGEKLRGAAKGLVGGIGGGMAGGLSGMLAGRFVGNNSAAKLIAVILAAIGSAEGIRYMTKAKPQSDTNSI